MSSKEAPDVVQQRLGLGCARLGSVLGDQADASRLVHIAFDRGIRFFDTANIYGQGESEQILGTALQGRRRQVSIVTKAGQYFPAWMNAARPFKRLIKTLIHRSGSGRQLVSKVRQAPLPQNFSAYHLNASIEASLQRLKTDYVDIFLLHSPPPNVIADGEALGTLVKIRAAGKVVKIGISCEGVEAGLLALDDPRVEAIELPLWPMTEATERFLDRARSRGVFVIGRGIMSAAPPVGTSDRWAAARQALVLSLTRPEVSRVLIGTTRVTHLDQILDAAQKMDNARCL